MSSNIKVALLGLGEIGQEFAENFLMIIQEQQKPVEIVAVHDQDLDSPVVLGFSQSGVRVLDKALDVIDLGDPVDVIFDLTGDSELRSQLRQQLAASGNRHTVLAPEVIAQLIWLFFDTEPQAMAKVVGGY